MPNIAQFLTILGRNWYFLLAAAGVIGLLIAYGAAYLRALQPKTGTLEWIALYDRPGFSMAGRWHPMERADAGPFACTVLLTAALWAFAAWRTLSASYGAALPAEAIVHSAVAFVALPAAASCCAYLLFKGLMGNTPAAAFSTLLLGLDLSAAPVPMAFGAASMALLCRHLTAPADDSFTARLPWLVASFALLTAGCYFTPSLAALAAAALVLVLAGCMSRFVQQGRGYLFQSLLTVLLTVAVTAAAVHIPGFLIAEGHSHADGASLAAGGILEYLRLFFQFTAHRLAASFSGLFRWAPLALVPALLYDWPLLLCGLCALAAALAGLFRRKDFRGLILVMLFLAAASMWLLCRTYALPLACAACLCYVWADLCQREKSGLTSVGAACLLLILASLYVMSWII